MAKTITTEDKGRKEFNKAKAILEADKGRNLQNHEALQLMREIVFQHIDLQ